MDKLKEQKTHLGKGGADSKRRRPSTIAEQPSKVLPGVEDFQSLRLRTTSESERDMPDKQTIKVIPSGILQDKVEMGRTEHKCLTCNSVILDNTTSTTSCVKCAKLRIRRKNFANPPPMDGSNIVGRESSDSGVSSGSQECNDIIPSPSSVHPGTLPLMTRRNQEGVSNINSSQFSTLVRKLSEVEGINPSHILRSMKSSIDEGVELDYPDSDSLSTTSSQHTPGSSSMWTCDSQTSSVGRLSSSGSHSGSGGQGSGETDPHSSNYPSIENFSFDPSWSQSLPSCNDGSGATNNGPTSTSGNSVYRDAGDMESGSGALHSSRGVGVR